MEFRKVFFISITVFLLILGLVGLDMWQHTKNQPYLPSNMTTPIPDEVEITPTQSASRNILVDLPIANTKLTLPFVISGQARVFENQLHYRLKDEDGKTILEGEVTANAPDAGKFGPFAITISAIPAPQGEKGIVEVFDYSAKDGTEIDNVTIPIIFDTNQPRIQAFFQSKNTSDTSSCTTVVPRTRYIAMTPAPARVALEQLLIGPTATEKGEGYYTSIPSNLTIQKLTIANGIARVDFSKELEQGVGGSCRVAAIRAQITKTLQQFPTVKEVVISIDGRIEDILQP